MRGPGQFFEALKIAMSALRANKGRSVLTALGIIIGIIAVVTTMTAANGLANNFKESVSALGSDVLYVSRTPWVVMGNWFQFRNRPRVKLDEVEELARRLPDALAVNPTIDTNRAVKFRSTILEDISVIGTTDQHMLISSASVGLGRFMTPFEVQSRKKICVIGETIQERLFDNADALNKKIKIGRHTFRVVGVMEKQGGSSFFGGPDLDSQIYIPVTTFTRAFGGANRHINIAVKAPSQETLEDFEYALVGEMRKIRKLRPTEDDNFAINTMDSLVGMFNNVMGVVLLIGLVITTISLFVGGIGVMNIMYVSVTERTREIGIRRAIGAKRRAIMAQFLSESVAICALGGLIGLAGAYAVTAAINKFIMPAWLSPGIALVALLVSTTVGILFGFLPAWKAARLRPIEALRYE